MLSKNLLLFQDRPEACLRAIASYKKRPSPLLLRPAVKNYDWGMRGKSAPIPGLLGIRPDENRAYAELWIGAHPLSPAGVSLRGLDPAFKGDESSIALDTLLESDPEFFLGKKHSDSHGGQFPFLMKVLSAARTLSIQAHPNPRQAREGFAREESAGIPRNAADRNYRDPNPKPELLIALTDLYALNRFLRLSQIAELWEGVPELAPTIRIFRKKILRARSSGDRRAVLKDIYHECMTMSSSRANDTLSRLAERLNAGHRRRPYGRDSREYWFLKTEREIRSGPDKDRGLFAFYLLNLVHLRPDEGIFVPPGEPHSCLEGVGVEIMANSDNSLRGGLTAKHVDLPELLRTLNFNAGRPFIVRADRFGNFRTPAKEFAAGMIDLRGKGASKSARMNGVEILFVMKGRVDIESRHGAAAFPKGSSILIPAALRRYRVRARSASAREPAS